VGLLLEIDFTDLNRFAQRIGNVTIRAQDIRYAAEGIRIRIQIDVDNRFLNAPATTTGGTVPGGAYWVELSEAYLNDNQRRLDGQILRDTGELQQSLTDRASPYNIFEVSPQEFVFGTALLKAAYLNQYREFLFWHPTLLNEIAQYIIDSVSGLE